MKKFLSFSLGMVAVLALGLGMERRAMAYVDPGSGLLALQAAGSAIAATVYFMRRRLLAIFGKKTAVVVAPAGATIGVKSDRKTA